MPVVAVMLNSSIGALPEPTRVRAYRRVPSAEYARLARAIRDDRSLPRVCTRCQVPFEPPRCET